MWPRHASTHGADPRTPLAAGLTGRCSSAGPASERRARSGAQCWTAASPRSTMLPPCWCIHRCFAWRQWLQPRAHASPVRMRVAGTPMPTQLRPPGAHKAAKSPVRPHPSAAWCSTAARSTSHRTGPRTSRVGRKQAARARTSDRAHACACARAAPRPRGSRPEAAAARRAGHAPGRDGALWCVHPAASESGHKQCRELAPIVECAPICLPAPPANAECKVFQRLVSQGERSCCGSRIVVP